MNKYWNINDILSYNRNFNFINGERSIGKSYTTQMHILNKAIKKREEFIYIVRTQDEKNKKIFQGAFEKVIAREFKEYVLEFSGDTLILKLDDMDIVLGYCIALSECVKIKKRSFPNVKYMMFDEYMLEESQKISYVNGWKEPDLFLSIYHTVDREEDRVICFLLGNNTSFYNPYHLHSAFNIQPVKKGEIWKNKYCLYQWATATGQLKNEKNNCNFLNMIAQTSYGRYAVQGDYVDDNINFIEKRPENCRQYFTFNLSSEYYGVWYSNSTGNTYISDKCDKSSINLAFSPTDHNEKTFLFKDKNNALIKWLASQFKKGNLKYENMEIKKKTQPSLLNIM